MTRDCWKENNLQGNWLTFGLLVYRRKREWVTTLDGSKRENEKSRNPKESIKGFVRGKNYEALVVSPPKGFETPLTKFQKKLLTSITLCVIINPEDEKKEISK